MRKELEEALRSLSLDELTEARRFIDRLLTQLEQSGSAPRPAPSGGAERRRLGRFAVNLPVTYFRHRAAAGAASGPAVHEAVVRDISRSGVRFYTHEALGRDEVLTIYLPGPQGVRKLFVEVIRTERRGTQCECGAAFIGLDRILAAQKAEDQHSEAIQVLLVCEPCPERDALTDALARQGYTVEAANSVPEACSMLGAGRSGLVMTTAPMLEAEGGRLLKELQTREGAILSIAIAPASDMDGPQRGLLRACHDFISEPERAQEVRVVVGRCYRRLMAARARRAAP